MATYKVILYTDCDDSFEDCYPEEFKFRAETEEKAYEEAERLMIAYDAFDYLLEGISETNPK